MFRLILSLAVVASGDGQVHSNRRFWEAGDDDGIRPLASKAPLPAFAPAPLPKSLKLEESPDVRKIQPAVRRPGPVGGPGGAAHLGQEPGRDGNDRDPGVAGGVKRPAAQVGGAAIPAAAARQLTPAQPAALPASQPVAAPQFVPQPQPVYYYVPVEPAQPVIWYYPPVPLQYPCPTGNCPGR